MESITATSVPTGQLSVAPVDHPIAPPSPEMDPHPIDVPHPDDEEIDDDKEIVDR